MSLWQNRTKGIFMKIRFFLLAFLFQAGCTCQNKPAGNTAAVLTTGRNPGSILLIKCKSQVEIQLNDTLVFQFSEYPGMGYSWYLVSPDSTLKVLKPAGVKKYSPEDKDGAEGKAEFYFRAVKQGKELLKFSYSRPWEKTKPAADSCITKVIVYSPGDLSLPGEQIK
jgi:predicted secreted protein